MINYNSNRLRNCALVAIALFIFGCAPEQKSKAEKYSEARLLMGTMVRLDVCLDERNLNKIDQAYKNIWQRLEDISWRMNVLDEKSDVSKVNKAILEPVTITADTYQVLRDSVYFSRLSQGAFDITVWPLIQLWKESEQNDIIPSHEKLTKVREAVGLENIQLLPNNQVKLLNQQTRIDLGGIAKGYAVDEAAGIFRNHGILNFFIDAGGDIYVGGHNCEGKAWRIGIRDPRDNAKIVDVVNVIDAAVTTSGHYEQYYEIQGQRWSHIINPGTGYPQRDVVSATVIAPKAEEADALSTALCVLGEKQGTDLINNLNESYASLIMIKQGSDRIIKFASQNFKIFK